LINVTDSNDNSVNSKVTKSSTAEDTGDGIKVKLKNGESVTISGLEAGYKYTIKETTTNSDSTGIVSSGGTSENISETDRTISGAVSNDSVEVTYTNTYKEKEVPVPTGIRMDVLPYVLIMMITIIGLFGFAVRRRITKGR
jgi:hypothetical protein